MPAERKEIRWGQQRPGLGGPWGGQTGLANLYHGAQEAEWDGGGPAPAALSSLLVHTFLGLGTAGPSTSQAEQGPWAV